MYELHSIINIFVAGTFSYFFLETLKCTKHFPYSSLCSQNLYLTSPILTHGVDLNAACVLVPLVPAPPPRHPLRIRRLILRRALLMFAGAPLGRHSPPRKRHRLRAALGFGAHHSTSSPRLDPAPASSRRCAALRGMSIGNSRNAHHRLCRADHKVSGAAEEVADGCCASPTRRRTRRTRRARGSRPAACHTRTAWSRPRGSCRRQRSTTTASPTSFSGPTSIQIAGLGMYLYSFLPNLYIRVLVIVGKAES